MTHTYEDIVQRVVLREAAVTEVDTTTRSIVAVLSAETVDRMNEVIQVDGIHVPPHVPMLLQHDRQQLPIGQWVDIRKTRVNGVRALVARGVFADDDLNETARVAWRLVKSGAAGSVSIGFLPLRELRPPTDEESRQWPRCVGVWDETDLLEASVVTVPANRLASILEVHGKAFEARDLALCRELGLMSLASAPAPETDDLRDLLGALDLSRVAAAGRLVAPSARASTRSASARDLLADAIALWEKSLTTQQAVGRAVERATGQPFPMSSELPAPSETLPAGDQIAKLRHVQAIVDEVRARLEEAELLLSDAYESTVGVRPTPAEYAVAPAEDDPADRLALQISDSRSWCDHLDQVARDLVAHMDSGARSWRPRGTSAHAYDEAAVFAAQDEAAAGRAVVENSLCAVVEAEQQRQDDEARRAYALHGQLLTLRKDETQ